MTVFLYLPVSIISGATHYSAEHLLILFTGVFFLAALMAALHVLRGSVMEGGRPLFIGLCVPCAWLMWLNIFAEREHLAVMALLPFFALWQVRSQRRPAGLAAVIVAGLGGGLATAIKPFFCLCLILPAICAAISRRDLRAALSPEYWIAAVVALTYVTVALLAYPVYFRAIVPVLKDTYLAYRLAVPELLLRPEWGLCLSWIAVLTCVRPGWLMAWSWALAAILAGIGFFIAYLMQAKGYANHVLAAVSLVALGVLGLTARAGLLAVRDAAMPFLARSLTLLGVAWVAGTLVLLTVLEDRPLPLRALALLQPIKQLSAAKTLLAISPDLDVGHPLARSAGARYVGSVSSLWLTGSALQRRDRSGTDNKTKARMNRYIAWDMDRLSADVLNNKPDLIVLDSAHVSRTFIRRQAPAAAAAIADYQLVAALNGIELLKRRPPPTPSRPAADGSAPQPDPRAPS